METIIITLLGINLYLLFDYVLDNYYFNGTKTKEGLLLNRHLYYEYIQILLLVVMIFITAFYLPGFSWISMIYPICVILLWFSRIQDTYKNWACEIQINKEKVVFIDNEGKENTIELPSYFSIHKEEGNRFSFSSKSMDYVLRVKNNNGDELNVNLSESSLDSYVSQIHKTSIKNFGAKAYDGIKPKQLNYFKTLLISLFILICLLLFLVINRNF
jgi:hypothetical protein